MLTEKDYCDYETSITLGELGFPLKRMKVKNFINGKFSDSIVTVLLYEAQKWLREEKGYHIEIDRVGRSTGYDWQVSVVEMEHNLCKSVEHNNETYEEALSEGIKEAIKLLKEK